MRSGADKEEATEGIMNRHTVRGDGFLKGKLLRGGSRSHTRDLAPSPVGIKEESII